MRVPVILVKRNNREYFNVWGTEYPRHKGVPIQQDAQETAIFAVRIGCISDAQALEAYAAAIK